MCGGGGNNQNIIKNYFALINFFLMALKRPERAKPQAAPLFASMAVSITSGNTNERRKIPYLCSPML